MKSKNLKKLLVCTMSLVMSASLLVGCKNASTAASNNEKSTATSTTSTTKKKAKYVFLFIGDGNAMPQISAAENFLGAQNDKTPNAKKLCFSTFPAQGMNTTYSSDSFITDSAASGTAIATGNKTNSGEISMATDMKTKYKTLGEIAKEKDMKVGIVTSVTINHATPAVFYSHNKSRHNYYDIGLDLVNSNFDYFAGGNINHAKEDGKEDLYKLAKDKGYTVTKTKEDFDKLNSNNKKILATSPVLDGGALPYAIDKDSNKITLAAFTKKGIDVLDNSKGFFMMVEGGKIDWACHANDAASSIYDTLAFNDSVKEALKFYDKHPDETLIVVTADHETGGLTLGFAGTGYSNFYDKLKAQKVSYVTLENKVTEYAKSHKTNAKFEDLMSYITKNFGLTTAKGKSLSLTDYELTKLKNAFNKSMKLKNAKDADAFIESYKEEEKLLYGTYDPLSVTVTHILNQKSGIAWTSYSHTGIPIPTFAKGVGEESFNGYYDNTDIFKKLNSVIDPK